MQRNILRGFAILSFAALTVNGQQQSQPPAAPAPSQGSQTLPPGLQQRQQLPPGLNQRPLPPGLAGRADTDDSAAAQAGQSGNNGLYDTNYDGQPGIPATNFLGRFGTNWNRLGTNFARFGTNAYEHLTNAWTSLSNRFNGTNGGLFPTGNGTNRVYSTNSYSATNRFGGNFRDEAYTTGDQRLLIQIRQIIQPVFITGAANQGPIPVHFQCREGVVTMLGFVPDEEHKRRCETLVREVPGVVQVVDQLQVGAQGETQLGSAPSAPSAQLAATDQAFTANDQRLLIQLKQQVQPVIGNSEPWMPVHFVCREGVVTLVGMVPNEQQKQQIFEVVQRTPGVVQVVNQIQVNVNAETAFGGAGGAATNGLLQSGAVVRNTNYFGGTFGRTNLYGANTNFSATGRTNGLDRVYPGNSEVNSNLPPGLRKREDLPPGLQRQGGLPPGLEKRSDTNQNQ